MILAIKIIFAVCFIGIVIWIVAKCFIKRRKIKPNPLDYDEFGYGEEMAVPRFWSEVFSEN